jgi:hypothetical protein
MVNPRFLVETSNASNESSTAGITAAWHTISAELTAEMSVSPDPTLFASFAVFGGPTWYPSAGEPAANGEQGAWADTERPTHSTYDEHSYAVTPRVVRYTLPR